MLSPRISARASWQAHRLTRLALLIALLLSLIPLPSGAVYAAPLGAASAAFPDHPSVTTVQTRASAPAEQVAPTIDPAALAGPETPVNDWTSSTLQAGTKGISALIDLPDGRVFAAIQGDGLRVYTPDANGIYSWQSGPAGGPTNVTALAYLNGQLWAGTTNAGVSVFTFRSNSWSTFTSANSPLPGNNINRLTAVDRPSGPDDLWVSTTAGAARYREITNTPATWQIFTTANGLPSNNIYDVANWELDNTTLTYFATDAGVRSYNGTTMSAVNGGDGCLFDRATRILVDRANLIWFAAEVNIPALAAQPADTVSAAAAVWQPIGACRYAFSIFGGLWTAHSQSTLPWPSNNISDMSVDRSGRVWFSFLPLGNGSTGGGAAFDRGHWLVLKQPTAPLVTASVSHLQAVGETVWFGHSDASAFSVYSPNWSYWSETDLAASNAPSALLLESDESWVGAGTQLNHWNGQSWQTLTIPGSSPISAMTRGSDGLLWIGTATDGLYAYDNVNNFAHYTTAEGLAGNSIRALHTDAVGRLWVATASGLTLRGNGSWLAFTTSNSDLSSDDLHALTSDSTGQLWIGTAANGIAILDPEANGKPAWSSQTTADGLPSNVINGLATAPDGALWAATTAGVAKWDPASASWSTFTTSDGLTTNEILTIAADPTGLIWVGTAAGVARYDGTAWLALHVTGSFLGADHVPAVAADESRLWVLGGAQVAVRSTVIEPIGNKPPVILTITPNKGAPLSTVTIAGTDFDGAGPEFNEVRFCCLDGQSGIPAPKAQVLSATSTQLVIKVPELVKSGKITLKTINGQSQSPGDFTVTPTISSLEQSCVGIGDTLVIHGSGFTGSGSAAAYVTVGNGPERLADKQSPGEIRQYIRNDDTAGTVKVRLLSGESATSAASVSIANIKVDKVAVQQGVSGQKNVWGKRTLVQLTLVAQGGCNTLIDGGRLLWKLKDGTTRGGGSAYFTSPSGLVVKQSAQPMSLNNAVNFVAEFNSARSNYSTPFPLNQLAGVRVILRHGFQDVLTHEIPASSFGYIDTGANRTFTTMAVFPESGGTNYATFWKDARQNMAQAARIYPQQDTAILNGPQAWMGYTPIYITRSDLISFTLDYQDEIGPIIDDVDDYLDPSGDRYGVALADPKAMDPRNNGAGLSVGSQTAFVVNSPTEGGKTFMHEAMHNFGAVDSDQANYLDNYGGHSRYDEGQWRDNALADKGLSNCDTSLTFRQALIDETGAVRTVYRLDSGQPVQLSLATCGTSDGAKSILSYAPNHNNNNVFLEPLDYQYALDDLDALAQRTLRAAAVQADETMHLAGEIDLANAVTITIAAVESNAGAVTPVTIGALYRLQLRDANNQLLHDQPFDMDFAGGHTHLPADQDQSFVPTGPIQRAHFNLRVPFPAGTVKAEIRHDDQIIWSKSASANAPTVAISAPNGGTFAATDTIAVSWSAADADSDRLLYALDYSADNGQSWILLVPSLTGTRFNWQPNFIPASATALLRVRASDGFKSATATSAPFALTAHAPLAFVLQPSDILTFTEGTLLDLVGGSLTAAGFDEGSFVWRYDGVQIGTTKDLSFTLSMPGEHRFTVEVTADGMSATDEVTVTVIADYDHDGMPDAWELVNKLNPLDAADGYSDADGDLLNNLDEYQVGTQPRQVDTDGDGAGDGAEMAAFTDPLRADQKPAQGPVLRVGTGALSFQQLTPASPAAPRTFWVTNGGSGTLTWSVSSDAAWLKATPTQGSAPTEATVTTTAEGLADGLYTGHLTFTAAGAAQSPTVITVQLLVGSGTAHQLFLPIVSR